MVMADSRFHQSMDHKPSILAAVFRFLGQLVLPGLAFLVVAVLAFLDRDAPVSLIGAARVTGVDLTPGGWFTMAHVWILALFLVANLTGRRYGLPVTLGSLALATGLIAGFWAYATYGEAHVILPAPVLAAVSDTSLCIAVVLSVLTGLLINVVVFDLVRGRPWWKAPLLAPLFGGIAFAALFHGLANDTLGGDFGERFVAHLGIVAFATLVMLVIYHALRGMIPPAAGYGGA